MSCECWNTATFSGGKVGLVKCLRNAFSGIFSSNDFFFWEAYKGSNRKSINKHGQNHFFLSLEVKPGRQPGPCFNENRWSESWFRSLLFKIFWSNPDLIAFWFHSKHVAHDSRLAFICDNGSRRTNAPRQVSRKNLLRPLITMTRTNLTYSYIILPFVSVTVCWLSIMTSFPLWMCV